MNNMLSQFSQKHLRGNSFTRASCVQVLELLQSVVDLLFTYDHQFYIFMHTNIYRYRYR